MRECAEWRNKVRSYRRGEAWQFQRDGAGVAGSCVRKAAGQGEWVAGQSLNPDWGHAERSLAARSKASARSETLVFGWKRSLNPVSSCLLNKRKNE